MCHSVFRIDSQGFLIIHNRIGRLAHAPKSAGQIAVAGNRRAWSTQKRKMHQEPSKRCGTDSTHDPNCLFVTDDIVKAYDAPPRKQSTERNEGKQGRTAKKK